jgi:hypothetical protein
MSRSRLPQKSLPEAFYLMNGTLSQVLDESIVAKALRRELSESSADGNRNSISGFRTALLLSTVFWVLLFVGVSFVV